MVNQFTNIVGGFEQCQPPFCSQDFSVNINQFECSGNIVYVGWSITDQHNREWTVNSNAVQYSLNGQSFSSLQQSEGTSNGFNNYSTYFEKPSGEGLLYIKIKAQINIVFVEGYPDNRIPLNLDSCVSVGGDVVVPVSVCSQTPFDSAPVYILKNILPIITEDSSTTFYFEKDGYCWFVDKDNYDANIMISNIDYPRSAILFESIDQSDIKSNCDVCAPQP